MWSQDPTEMPDTETIIAKALIKYQYEYPYNVVVKAEVDGDIEFYTSTVETERGTVIIPCLSQNVKIYFKGNLPGEVRVKKNYVVYESVGGLWIYSSRRSGIIFNEKSKLVTEGTLPELPEPPEANRIETVLREYHLQDLSKKKSIESVSIQNFTIKGDIKYVSVSPGRSFYESEKLVFRPKEYGYDTEQLIEVVKEDDYRRDYDLKKSTYRVVKYIIPVSYTYQAVEKGKSKQITKKVNVKIIMCAEKETAEDWLLDTLVDNWQLLGYKNENMILKK